VANALIEAKYSGTRAHLLLAQSSLRVLDADYKEFGIAVVTPKVFLSAIGEFHENFQSASPRVIVQARL
jgi:hypothetical protein